MRAGRRARAFAPEFVRRRFLMRTDNFQAN